MVVWPLVVLVLGACAGDPPPEEDDGFVPRVVGPPGVPAPPPQQPAPSAEGNVVTYPSTSLGLAAFSANGRIHPHGAPAEHYFEYGKTADYGSKTPVKKLPGRLAAYYRETWDTGLGGFAAGAGEDLKHVAEGATGFARYKEPTNDDFNHVDGVGIIRLAQYFYIGEFSILTSARLGGARPDMRDAKVRVVLRGVDWSPQNTDLVWWSQADARHGVYSPGEQPVYSDWAHTGFYLTEALLTGKWETVEYRLYNDTTDWSYAGANVAQGRDKVYIYTPLENTLAYLDTDAFHNILHVDPFKPHAGTIDFDDLELQYRNHSLVFPSNGGKLVSAPAGSDNPAGLTDGWRHGPGKMWQSAPWPLAPQELIYDFEQPVTIERVLLHQHPDYPSKEVEVFASMDGTTWTAVLLSTIPRSAPSGPNFTYLFEQGFSAPARKLKVRILNGYRPEFWGLGEIEIFGTGSTERTDDDWYRVTDDMTGLEAGTTYHYRLVSVIDGRTELGGDLVYTVPADPKPLVSTGAALRVGGGNARLEARINSLGLEAMHYFEFGPTATYGLDTERIRTGVEITPRPIVARLDQLQPGVTVHYRAVVVSAAGVTYGDDRTFVAK